MASRKRKRNDTTDEQVGLQDMRFFQHSSAGSVREMFLLLGEVVRESATNPFSDVRSFGLLCDEANDVANKEQLITFIKFANPTMVNQTLNFLLQAMFLRSRLQQTLQQ